MRQNQAPFVVGQVVQLAPEFGEGVGGQEFVVRSIRREKFCGSGWMVRAVCPECLCRCLPSLESGWFTAVP